MLKQRIITASVLIPTVLWLIFWGSAGTFALGACLVVAIGGWEWAKLAGLQQQVVRIAVAVAVVGICYLLWPLRSTPDYLLIMSGVVILLSANMLQVLTYDGAPAKTDKIFFSTLLAGLVLLPSTWLSLLWLHQLSPRLLFLLMLLIWIADSGAYFSGKQWGKTKLAPRVSPGKTWEGVFGGMAAVALFALCVSFFLFDHVGQQLGFIVLVMIGIAYSVFGDLYESMLKRRVGVKDSSQILPGHGGVLDRTDSMIAAMPVFSVGLILIEHYL